jgi:glycosyltransferase involved in cell wall biosynthesis
MLCSIIIPLYNKASYIEKTIQSILAQSHQNFEIIVVDDGSKDAGPVLVGAFQDDRIHLIRQANGGVSRARNVGIDSACGELICFLDADDLYHPSYLETVVSMAKKNIDIVFFATSYVRISSQDLTVIDWAFGDHDSHEIIDDFFYRWRFDVRLWTGTVAVRRLNLIQLQPCFPVGESVGEDHDLWFRLSELYKLAYCPEKLAVYRVGVEDSLSASHEMFALPPSYLRLEQRALAGDFPPQLCSSALALVSDVKVTVARTFLKSGQRRIAFKHLLGIRRGFCSKRWWVSLIMCFFSTSSMVKLWDNWRVGAPSKNVSS